ncbi:hypothetical protein [Glutamicibacter sp.]|uniref:hypothetical protein n=1 Tax=Glutamicibacter sp. TaxID=1931995 RepID=UPI0028BF0260|nr:hypothetical protein [Glutamicibacter sp.]
MGDEIYLARLDEIIADLGASIKDFENASEITKNIESAVGNPKGKGDLKDRVGDFENDWNDTRDDLVEKLDGVHTNLKDIQKAFQEWDLETKKAFLNSREKDTPK